MTRAAEGDWADAVAALDLALATGEEVTDLDVLGNLGNAALQLGDDEAQQRFYTVALSRAREAGAAMACGLRAAAALLRLPRCRRLGGGAQQCARKHSRSAPAWGSGR